MQLPTAAVYSNRPTGSAVCVTRASSQCLQLKTRCVEQIVVSADHCFMVASGGVLSDGYGHGGHGVCLGDGQTKARVPSQGGRGDALLRRIPDLT